MLMIVSVASLISALGKASLCLQTYDVRTLNFGRCKPDISPQAGISTGHVEYYQSRGLPEAGPQMSGLSHVLLDVSQVP